MTRPPLPGPPDRPNAGHAVPGLSGDPFVWIRNLGKGFREGPVLRVVFRDLSVRIFRGESVALLGRSGSGKSTLLNLVAGIDVPDRGDVFVGGTRLQGLSETGRTLFRRRHVGIVFQSFNLIPTLTVEENVRLPLELLGAGRARARAAASEILAKVGMGDRGNSFPDRLSGGEQQRIGIARALVHAPALLLADEPTGNLDAETGRAVTQRMFGLARDRGMTLIVATHSPEVAREADRVLFLGDGALREDVPGGDPVP